MSVELTDADRQAIAHGCGVCQGTGLAATFHDKDGNPTEFESCEWCGVSRCESILAARTADLERRLLIAEESGNAEAGEHEQLRAELAAAQKNQLETERVYIRLRDLHDMQMDAARAECDALQARLDEARVTWANCKTGWRLPRDVQRGMDAALDEGNTP